MLPTPAWLSTHRWPSIISAKLCEIVRPRPVPPYRRVEEESACEKASKIDFCLSAGIPIPLSKTEKRNSAVSGLASRRLTTIPISPLFVNLIALSSKFSRTCFSLKGSPIRSSGTLSAIS